MLGQVGDVLFRGRRPPARRFRADSGRRRAPRSGSAARSVFRLSDGRVLVGSFTPIAARHRAWSRRASDGARFPAIALARRAAAVRRGAFRRSAGGKARIGADAGRLGRMRFADRARILACGARILGMRAHRGRRTRTPVDMASAIASTYSTKSAATNETDASLSPRSNKTTPRYVAEANKAYTAPTKKPYTATHGTPSSSAPSMVRASRART